MRTIHFLAFVLMCLSFPAFAQEEGNFDQALSPRVNTEALIRQLGDDNYETREAAYEKLRQAGPTIFFYLQAAIRDKDVEISERAKELLQYIEPGWISANDEEGVRMLMQQYTNADSIQAKIDIVGKLTDWDGNFAGNGRSISALCRILLYEHEPIVRAEAAREIMAVPPIRYSIRQKWFDTASSLLSDIRDDVLVDMAILFIQTRDKAIEYREKVMFDDNPEPPDSELVKNTRTLADKLRKFRDSREYYEGRRGTNSDILLFYALAEIQEALKMEEELNETLFQALDVIPIITEDGVSPYMSHCLAANYLEKRDMAVWAKNEYMIVLQKEPRLKTPVTVSIGFLNEELGNISKAAEQLGIAVETIDDPNPSNPGNDFYSGNAGRLKARHKYLLAKIAYNNDNIDDAKKWLDEAAMFYPDEADCLILRYKIGKKDGDNEFQKRTDELMKHSLADLNIKMRGFMQKTTPSKEFSLPFNQAAWLLSNTDGDYSIALPAAKKALEFDPEYPGVLDTLSHVYFLGEEYDLAIETQKTAVKYAPQVKLFRDVLERFEEAKLKSLE